jgi:hypothetical protein
MSGFQALLRPFCGAILPKPFAERDLDPVNFCDFQAVLTVNQATCNED